MKKKVLFIVLPIVIVLAIGGFLYWKFISSPEYSLAKINESIENHDITTFEKYVDVDGIIMRLMSQIPDIIGGNKKAAMFGEEINQLILSVLQGPILKIAKESVRTVIERGHFDKSITQKDLMAELLKQVPIDTIKIIGLKEIRKQGKVCTVPIQIYVGAYEGETTLELMMRNKGNYWQVAEISNLPKVIYDIAELKKTLPYKDRYEAVLYMAYSIEDADAKDYALAGIATEMVKAGKIEKAIEVAGSIKDAGTKSRALAGIATELAKAGKTKKAEVFFSEAIEVAGSIKDARFKGYTLAGIATELAKAGKIEKAIEIAGSIKDARIKAYALAGIATELAKAGKIEKTKVFFSEAFEVAGSIKNARSKAYVLAGMATTLARLKTKDKQEDAEIANSIMTALNR